MAVYTPVTRDEAERFLSAYDLGTLESLTPIQQGIDNSNFILTTTRGRFILTLYEKRLAPEDIPFFLHLLEQLEQRGVPCPRPLRAREGSLLRELNARPAALVTFLNGKMPNRITPEICAEAGRGLARLHLAGLDFSERRPNALGPEGWSRLFAQSADRADTVQPGLAALIREELIWLREHWPQDLPQGIIHADFFPDNVFFADNRLCGVIDFYFACTDLLAYDLAIVLNAWAFEHDVAFNITKARALLRGYEEVRVLSAAERTALPLLARGAAMRFLQTRLYDWLHPVQGAFVRPHDPLRYLTRLRFHQQVSTLAAYGLDA